MKRLKALEVSSGHWKTVFTMAEADRPNRVNKLIRLLADRTRDGRLMNLAEWRAYSAIDIAYQVPFAQTTPTLINNLLSKNLSADDTLQALKGWGLSEDTLFMDAKTPDGKACKAINRPVFYNIYVPLVKAYVTIRTAKMFGDRNSSPLLPFNPVHQTGIDRVRCAILTDMIQKQAGQMGYSAVLRQAIHQQNMYGIMLAFPREEWYWEQQEDEIQDPLTRKPKVHTVKEGLRYIHPHPTRMFYDLRHPLTSLNSDTGCEWAGHWHVVSYGDIFDNRHYWNKSSIFCGTNWFMAPGASRYFEEVFPCVMDFPTREYAAPKREDKSAYYSNSDRDKSVFLTEIFCKIRPRDWDLGDYGHQVWCRFTLAGDDTVVWAEPCAYCPPWFMGYDYDEQSDQTSSLALECIPWQDMVGNIISQMAITAQQNLMNVIFWDKTQVDKADIDALKQSGWNKFRATNWIPYDSGKMSRMQVDQRQAFVPVQLTKATIQEYMQLLPITLNLLERVLQISAQEAGAQATHQQSKFEVQQTGGAVSTRLDYTGSYTDEGIDAWKRQLVNGNRNYKDVDVVAEIPSNLQDVDLHLSEMGFRVISRTGDRVVVKGPKRAVMELEDFAATNQGPGENRDKELSQVLFQTIGLVASNRGLAQQVGPENLLKWIEQATILAGGPEDFRLPLQGQGGEITPQMQQALQALQQTIMQAVDKSVAQPAAQAVAKVQGEVEQQAQMMEQLKGIFDIAKKQADAGQIKVAEAQQAMQIDQAKFQADEARKTQAAASEQQRKDASAKAEIDRKAASAVAKTHTDALVKTLEARMSAQPEQRAMQQRMIESMNYKDQPDAIKRQMELQAGFAPAYGEDAPPEKVAKIKAAAKPKKPAK